MKNNSKLTHFLFVLSILFLFSCSSYSTDQLTKEVIANMEQSEQFKNSSSKVESLILTKKTNTEYSGILKTKEPNGNFTYSIEVVCDGKTFNWKILN